MLNVPAPELPGIPLALAEALVLVSLWKPVVFAVPVVFWARIASGILDKHAAQYYLPRRMWNIVHMGAALAALAAAVLLGSLVGGEGGFYAGLAALCLILAGDVVAYTLIANADERVGAKGRLTFKTLFGAPLSSKAPKKGKEKDGKLAAGITFAIRQPDEKGRFSATLAPPNPETPEFETRAAGEAAVVRALAARASQMDIGPAKDGQYASRHLVDGVYQPGETLQAAVAVRIIDFWKTTAKQDANDRRRRQVGDILLEDGAGKRLVRVTSIGAQGGMRLTLLFDPERAVTRLADHLGLLDMQVTELKAIAEERKGVVLICSPPDSGRTTLLYSVLRLHDAYINNVQTVEIEPQAAVEGVRMNKWDPNAPGADGGATPEFSTLVRSILRRDPDVVGVAELPDQATAKEITRADQERTRVYVSFKAGDPIAAVQTWVKAVGDTRAAADSLHGVVIGRLCRKLCTNCRVEYAPSGDMLRKLGIPEGKVARLFKKGGQVLIKNKPETCPVCGGIGYVGQEGLYEVCSIAKEDRDLVAQGNTQGLKASFRKRGLPTLQQVAIRKAVEGITSVEEITRAMSDGGSEPAGGTGGTGGPAAPGGAGAATGAAPPAPAKPAPPRSPAAPARKP